MNEVQRERLKRDMQGDVLSVIEDYCIMFGVDSLPELRDVIEAATHAWTVRPELDFTIEEE